VISKRAGVVGEVVLLVLCVSSAAFLLGQLVAFEYGRDQAIFAFAAERIVDGQALYRGAWDIKWPGIYFIYAAVRATLGPGMWAIRVLEALLVASMIVPFAGLSRRHVGAARAGVLGWAIAVYAHARLEFWNTAQTETFAGVAIVWALWLADREGRRAAWVLAGVLYGCAGLLKPTLGLAILATWVYLGLVRLDPLGRPWRARLREPGAALAAGLLLPVILTTVYFAVSGALPDAWEALFVVGPKYASERFALGYVPGLLLTAVVQWTYKYSTYSILGLPLLLGLSPLGPRERDGALHVTGVAALVLMGVAAQGRFFAYHFGAALPLGALLSGWGLWKLWVRWSRRAVGIVGFFALLFLLNGSRVSGLDDRYDFWQRCRVRMHALLHEESREEAGDLLYSTGDMDRKAIRKVASAIAEGTPPNARLYVWGSQPLLYWYSRRPPASRYCLSIPQRVPWERNAREKLLADLGRNPPDVVVVERGDAMPTLTGNDLDSEQALAGFPELASILSRGYERAFRTSRFDVLRPVHP
jgi:hypothetical protein